MIHDEFPKGKMAVKLLGWLMKFDEIQSFPDNNMVSGMIESIP
jgi:hypothetical protein